MAALCGEMRRWLPPTRMSTFRTLYAFACEDDFARSPLRRKGVCPVQSYGGSNRFSFSRGALKISGKVIGLARTLNGLGQAGR